MFSDVDARTDDRRTDIQRVFENHFFEFSVPQIGYIHQKLNINFFTITFIVYP